MAPEIIKWEPLNPMAADIWALGVILYYFITGDFPFWGQQSKDVYAWILWGMYTLPDAMPTNIKRLI